MTAALSRHSVTDLPALFIDADGTLFACDLLHEALQLLLQQRPRYMFVLPWWMLRGKAYFKHRVAELVEIDARTLPYRDEVLAFVAQEKSKGRRIVLATACHSRYARAISEHLAFFDDVLATDITRNLKGTAKCAAIREYCAEHGIAEFGYIGDSPVDAAVWRCACEIYVVSPSRSLLRAMRRLPTPTRVFCSSTAEDSSTPVTTATAASRSATPTNKGRRECTPRRP